MKREYELEKNELQNKNVELLEKINFLQKEIENSKNLMNKKDQTLQKYLDNYEKVEQENNIIKNKIENLEGELHLKNSEMNEKTTKIKNLENKNVDLESQMNKLKEIYNTESVLNKETKQNYDLIKNNYYDIKNQYDLLNIKYQTLSDENFNFKRDKLLYEKELKTKNQMIQNLLGKSSALQKKELQKKINIYKNQDEQNYFEQINYISKNTKKNNKYNYPNIREKYPEEENEEESGSNEEYKNNNEKEENIQKGKEDVNNNDTSVVKNEPKKKSKYDGLNEEELKKIRDRLLVERNDITNLYNKIPLKVHKMEQIKKREESEKKLAQINNDLMQIRLKLKGNI